MRHTRLTYHRDDRALLPALSKVPAKAPARNTRRKQPSSQRQAYVPMASLSELMEKMAAGAVALALVCGGVAMTDSPRREAAMAGAGRVGQSMSRAIESTIYDVADAVRLVGDSYLAALNSMGSGILDTASLASRVPAKAMEIARAIDGNSRAGLAGVGAALTDGSAATAEASERP